MSQAETQPSAIYPIAEVQGLYRTIAELRQQLAALQAAQTLGSADVVILREMREPMTRAQISEATGMHADYVHVRLSRLQGMGLIEMCGRAKRIGGGKGGTPWLWRVKPPDGQAFA